MLPAKSRTDWRAVRALAVFQILNRASMMILVAVPIITAARAFVKLPLANTLALLFFASLATLLARTVFDLRAPETVKLASFSTFVRDAKKEYVDTPSDTALRAAMDLLRADSTARPLIDEENAFEASDLAEESQLQARIDAARKEVADGTERSEGRVHSEIVKAARAELRDAMQERTEFLARDRGERGSNFRRRLALIELAATRTYLVEAGQRRGSALVALVAYGTAVGLSLAVIVIQSVAVAGAAGWIQPESP